jgi:hypothetical protein
MQAQLSHCCCSRLIFDACIKKLANMISTLLLILADSTSQASSKELQQLCKSQKVSSNNDTPPALSLRLLDSDTESTSS